MSARADLSGVAGDHVVQFYDHDQDLIRTVGRYVLDAIRAGEVAVVIATEEHRLGLQAELTAAGVDVADAARSGTLVVLDAARTLGQFSTAGAPDPEQFDSVIGGLLRRTALSGRSIRAYGEMVALLWDAGHVVGAIQLEQLWNDLARSLSFSLFCAYPSRCAAEAEHVDAYLEVCHLHTAVLQPRLVESLRLAPERVAPRHARHFVVETLRRWGFAEIADDAALVVTELATNAVVHAVTPFTVEVAAEHNAVRISVCDSSPALPAQRYEGPVSESGRGMTLVAAVSARWGSEHNAAGKVVWAEVR